MIGRMKLIGIVDIYITYIRTHNNNISLLTTNIHKFIITKFAINK